MQYIRERDPEIFGVLVLNLKTCYSASLLRPIEMLVQKIKDAHTIDCMRSGEPFNLASITDSQFGLIEVSDFREFVGDLFIRCDAVEVASFNHEWSRADQGSHFCVIKGASEIPLEDFILAFVRVAAAQGCLIESFTPSIPGFRPQTNTRVGKVIS